MDLYNTVKHRFLGKELSKVSIKNSNIELKKNIINTKKEIIEINQKIDYITDPILLNQLIFELKALEIRYQYWYKLAKEMIVKKI